MLSVIGRPTTLFCPSTSLAKPHPKTSKLLYYNNIPSLKISSSIKPLSSEDGNRGSNSSTRMEPMLSHANDEQYLEAGLQKDSIPKHIAVIFDGSRRWLKVKGRPLDYMPFFETNALFADLCLKWGVGTFTTFVYSYENLQRGKEANEFIFRQLEKFLEDNLENFIRKKIRVMLIGERNKVTQSLQDIAKQVEKVTSRDPNPKLEFRLAVCYGGTRDILQATRRLCEKTKAGLIEPNAIDDTTFDRELMAGNAPTPELLIRTGSELRLNNFLVWNLAQTEYYFLPIMAPDFTEAHFLDALRAYQQRHRDFGM